MRKQYHARQIGPDRFVWDIHRLVRLAAPKQAHSVSISTIAELDENWWYQCETDSPTPRLFAEHMALVQATDLKYPIILCSEGRLMDGMHRLVNALFEERETILAVKFEGTPEPDYINPAPEDLSYANEDL